MTKKFMSVVLFVILASVLTFTSGCFSSGNKAVANMELRAKIVKGQTTKQEILNMYGKPNAKIDLGDEGEEWKYKYVFVTSLGGKGTALVVRFNPDGVIERISEEENTTGLFK